MYLLAKEEYDQQSILVSKVTKMCTFKRTIYLCRHDAWGKLVQPCDNPACQDRFAHGLHSRLVSQKCTKCATLDGKMSLIKEKLALCRSEVDACIRARNLPALVEEEAEEENEQIHHGDETRKC